MTRARNASLPTDQAWGELSRESAREPAREMTWKPALEFAWRVSQEETRELARLRRKPSVGSLRPARHNVSSWVSSTFKVYPKCPAAPASYSLRNKCDFRVEPTFPFRYSQFLRLPGRTPGNHAELQSALRLPDPISCLSLFTVPGRRLCRVRCSSR
jgi:hypothetical protein